MFLILAIVKTENNNKNKNSPQMRSWSASFMNHFKLGEIPPSVSVTTLIQRQVLDLLKGIVYNRKNTMILCGNPITVLVLLLR